MQVATLLGILGLKRPELLTSKSFFYKVTIRALTEPSSGSTFTQIKFP